MRKSFVKILIELAEKDERVFLLTGDLGFNALEGFKDKFPERFINCGIAEQSMAGIAAGLALSGKKPYIYSIAPFVTLRCLEQIRNDICYQNLDVKIIGVGGGFSYGSLGSTHSLMHDVAILRSLPNMQVLCPADGIEAEELMDLAYKNKGPAYLRTLKAGGLVLHEKRTNLKIGEPLILKEGKKKAVIANGLQAVFALKAANELEGQDIKVINMHTVKPIEMESFKNCLEGVEKIAVFEEHSAGGGLGSAVLEAANKIGWQGKIKIFGLPDEFPPCIGTAEYLREKYKIDEPGIKMNIINFLEEK